MKSRTKFMPRIIDAVTMLLVCGLSLFLLMYVAFGEAQRTYQHFHEEKLMAHGRVVQNAMASFLRAGLPMKQYVGFATLVEPILASDGSIATIVAFDNEGQAVFAGGGDSIPLLPPTPSTANHAGDGYELRETERYLQVVMPLRSKFEAVGSLAITMPRSVVTQHVAVKFRPLALVALCLSLSFAFFVSIIVPRINARRLPLLQVVYALTFLGMSGGVVGTLITLYSDGAQAKTQALANSLGQRLTEIVQFNLNIAEIDGLDAMLSDYRRLNPDIRAAGLTVDGRVRIHTDPAMVGRPWVSQGNTYEYGVDLSPPGGARDIRIVVALPSDVVYRRIVRSVKNFAALFVASAFLAGLFLQLAGSIRRPSSPQDNVSGKAEGADDQGKMLDFVKPVFFVAVFLEHLNYAHLPQFMNQVVAEAGLSPTYVSAPFMAYYLFFALALIPAGHFAQQVNPRPLMYWGLLLAGCSLVVLAVRPEFYFVTAARAVSGAGQGMLFIGVQSYILAAAPPHRKTRGAGIIVFGFQGGMISGMAIGSLLVTYMGPSGVFTLSGLIALALAFYAMCVVPAAGFDMAKDVNPGMTLRQLGYNMRQILHSLQFLKTMILIGIPAKAILTGVIIFALPLLLAQMGYREEDIGQIIMVYAAGVVLASTYVSRLVDQTGKTLIILFWGAVISGCGLMLLGLAGWSLFGGGSGSPLTTAVIVFAVATVGVAHGFINAPVVTHIANSALAANVGASSLTATYRFLERGGHIVGPMIVGQLFIFGGQSALPLTWIGGVVLILGFLFLFGYKPSQAKAAKSEV
jgi:predicted MFS family arabinose efflux permease